jgi:hypothetical protein
MQLNLPHNLLFGIGDLNLGSVGLMGGKCKIKYMHDKKTCSIISIPAKNW